MVLHATFQCNNRSNIFIAVVSVRLVDKGCTDLRRKRKLTTTPLHDFIDFLYIYVCMSVCVPCIERARVDIWVRVFVWRWCLMIRK